MSDFNLLNNRNIINILIGDEKLLTVGESDLAFPYMSGPQLCTLCTQFGYTKNYLWGKGNLSRWMYMQELLLFLDKDNRIPLLLSSLFKFSRFEDILKQLNNPETIKQTYNNLINSALDKINSSLLFNQKELKLIKEQFVITNIGETLFIEHSKINTISLSYVRDLPERIKQDFETHNYDSVVTKSRTLIEEVLIYILEDNSGKRFSNNGKLLDLYKQCKTLVGMMQNGDWDKRINELLSGLEKIINAISSMRNCNSDAHGVGQNRINIQEREATLVANSSVLLSEFILSVYEQKKASNNG